LSRSWERKVRKNMEQANKSRKKQGTNLINTGSGSTASNALRITGRNFIAPSLLLIFIIGYSFLMLTAPNYVPETMFFVTIGCYVLLATLFFFRKPYLAIGKDFVQSRRFTGDKRLPASEIKEIRVHKDYVVVMPQKGGAWTFSRVLNRFPTEQMSKELTAFAQKNSVNLVEQ